MSNDKCQKNVKNSAMPLKKRIFAKQNTQNAMIVHNRLLPPPRFLAINLFGIIFVRHGRSLSDVDLNHEHIHTAQMIELLFVGFYMWYLVEWVVLFMRYRNVIRAYRNIRFEREAYDHERDLSYLRRRKLWAWARTNTAQKTSRACCEETTKIYHKHKHDKENGDSRFD